MLSVLIKFTGAYTDFYRVKEVCHQYKALAKTLRKFEQNLEQRR